MAASLGDDERGPDEGVVLNDLEDGAWQDAVELEEAAASDGDDEEEPEADGENYLEEVLLEYAALANEADLAAPTAAQAARAGNLPASSSQVVPIVDSSFVRQAPDAADALVPVDPQGSPGGAQPDLVAPPIALAPPGPAVRNKGVATVQVYGGSITFCGETAQTKSRFQAQCPLKDEHGQGCRLTRAGHAFEGARGTRRTAQGRPLGLLAAWLQCAGMCSSKEEHQVLAGMVSYEDRLRAREHLLEQPQGPEIAAQERPLLEGEPLEPVGLP